MGAVLARYSLIRVRTVSSLSSGRRLNSWLLQTSQVPSTFGFLYAMLAIEHVTPSTVIAQPMLPLGSANAVSAVGATVGVGDCATALTSPVGVSTSLKGYTTDVGQAIDPDTGQAVAGRRASVAVSRSSLPEQPEGIADSGRKPWVATFADSGGVVSDWKVIEVLPDRATGVVVLLLERYHAGAHL